MSRRSLRLWLAFALCAGVLAAPLSAAPQDVRVGDARAVFSRDGTNLATEPKPLSKPVARLAYGTLVRVDRVQLPWIQVSVTHGGTGTGWLRAVETIEPALLATIGRPIRALATAQGSGASSRDVSTAGRSLVEGSEPAYRTAHPDLERFYPMVDKIEALNRAVDPEALKTFVERGRLGRGGK